MTGRHITAAELDSRIGQVYDLVNHVGRQLAAHERWHRDMMTQAAESGSSHRMATAALVVATVAALAALVTALVPLTG